ncbi:PD-(D/E)XK nuclease family protein [Winogradskyella sp. SYSU M77433]|uniref:PD-(D/E)XK nuclease family protein n=1 Tax=Winogradskyella sp. SYSU M77433 TaxID=3042722 RepID=UPI002480BD02|nr:PD-(D/E)XK nuclease family protein [Winogradskyella sp. SYSU M77433]MDH7913846.1 PD-(D/E)XK nuclease family protein [Winogradskyella sp. SYSU M77433]
MVSFIQSVLLDLQRKNENVEDFVFILPSKRAGVFLKHHLSQIIQQHVFAPKILSIEEFVEELSGLKNIPNTDLLFILFDVYKKTTSEKDLEPFDSFSKWGQILLQDFNEIDRYLIPQEKIFDYLSAIKELDHWSVEKEQTDIVKRHLMFWKRLKDYYLAYTETLLENKQGYQGLIYREAVDNLEIYIENNSEVQHIFLGFNALNESESQIIQGLLQSDLANIYWDIDSTFINDPIHDAGIFTRVHKAQWKYFKNHSFNWITSHYKAQKNIEVIGVPKLVGQAKYIGQLLEHLSQTNENLTKTAVILGEENLLVPVLNSIPESVKALNVTMGLPLKFTPIASLFEKLFSIHKHNPKNFYYKDIVAILSHPSIHGLFQHENRNTADEIIAHIQKNNIVYADSEQLKKLAKFHVDLLGFLFNSWVDNALIALKNCSNLIYKMKANYTENSNKLELEYLYRFNQLFNQLTELNSTYKHLKTVATLHTIFKELLSSETLDFKGEPLEGLQIMGMLESRVLDFETIIISSVNEGILPSGKTNNSFIPFDVKVENNLPTYKEKDAVYTYHFYRLLQRAKNVYILYNTEIDALKGGEKSRFITQLDIEGIHNIKHKIASPSVPVVNNSLKQIAKNNAVIEKLKALSAKGFSPSSLTNYIRNPIAFYYEKVLGIKEFEDVEENIAANTLGSVIHNTLEDFYKPLEGKFLTIEDLNSFKEKTKETVTKHFKLIYNQGDFSKGKNLIIFEIAQRYISNFINLEIEILKAGNQIKILVIEADENVQIKIDELNFPVKLTGKVDRIDEFNGITRVIDYKSGKVEQNKVEIVDWEDLTTDYDKYSKSFQVLCYAYMMHQNNKIQLPIEGGIISFKNLGEGFLKFGKKPTPFSRTKDQLISQETLQNFETELKNLIIEICNPDVDFIEKELDQ